METTKINDQNIHTNFYKQWPIFTIVCESDFSRIHTQFPTIRHKHIAEFVTNILKTDTLDRADEQAIERALTAILQPGAEHVPFTVRNIQFHLYYTEILEPVFI